MGFYLRTDLRPQAWPVPFGEILAAWMAADLDPAACRAVVERAIARGMPEGLLDPAQVTAGGVVATERLLRSDRQHEPWRWTLRNPDGVHLFEVVPEVLPTIAELVRIAARADSRDAAIAEAGEYVDDAEMLAAFGGALDDARAHGTWRAPDAPGVYRREHACLAIRSESGALLVTDPQRVAFGWTTASGANPGETSWARARVLVTHGHDDHWDLASIASWAAEEDDVIVPRVPAPSLLADDMAAALARMGQAAHAPAWWERVDVGGIAVDALPFYGEQPARSLALPDGARNWGNCYRFALDGWSLAILVDSGVDAMGDMIDVLARSAREHGPIDVVMSCCLEFPEMLNPGLPHYAFALPFDELRARRATRGSMTSGPRGLAAACKAAGARWFLPYAHGFRGLGLPPVSVESGTSEAEAVGQIRDELARTGGATEVIEWNPGDVLRWRDGRPRVEI